ncbi:G-protein-signaling modulator 1 [Cololabis saira]|uniref:G-protein-signaling modulator 1 n=1 Tax=Cololabis saira TaxID=129043 RepID=UPI002AD335B7|nr:G-protein-signaling modulator 1 [Cololabis saira]
MADKDLPGSSSSSAAHISSMLPRSSPTLHQNGGLQEGPRHHSPSDVSQASSSSSPLRTFMSGFRSPGPGFGSEGRSGEGRPRGHSLGSAFRNRTPTSKRKLRTSKQDSEALLDLIMESQCQRLEDQRASTSLLPHPEPVTICGTCSPNQHPPPSLDFYYKLIQYQSDRMEEQRCSLPDLDDVVVPVPEGQEDFFRLVHRVQSRRMDEQRALMLLSCTKDEQDQSLAESSHHHPHHS